MMTITELWNKCLPSVKNKPTVKFETAKDKRLAIDISLWLHQYDKKQDIALFFIIVLRPIMKNKVEYFFSSSPYNR